jgi:hypothetical protein
VRAIRREILGGSSNCRRPIDKKWSLALDVQFLLRQHQSPTAMAATKLDCRFLNRQHFETMKEQKYETKVCTMKITGMIARSVSFSAVNCEPSLVKTRIFKSVILIALGFKSQARAWERVHTEAWGEQSHIEVCHQLLRIGIEHALPGGNITREADADDLQHSFEDKQY